MNQAAVELKLLLKQENRRKEFLKWKEKQDVADLDADIRNTSDNFIVPSRQRTREKNIEAKEIEIQQVILKEKEIENAKKSLEREKQLLNEMKLMQESKYCDEKRRMQLRMNSVELREFEEKLKNAYFRKDVDKLLVEKEEISKIEKEKRLKEVKQEYKQLRQDEEELLQYQEEIQREKLKYRDFLLKQQEEALIAKQQEYEEFLRDKLLIDEAMRKIQQEDKNRIQEKIDKRERTMNDITVYHNLRDSYKRRQAEELQRENEKAEKFVKAKDERDELHLQIKTEKRRSFEKLQTDMCEKLWTDKLKKLELDQAKEELAMEEYEKFLSDKDKAELARKKTIRQNLKEMFLDQLVIKADILKRQKEEEKEIQYFMIEKCEQEEKTEQQHAAERRRRQMEYRTDMRKVLADKQAQYVLQKEEEQKQQQKLEEMEKEYERSIKLEKIRLLKEHGKELLNYLPKGTIQNDFEIDFLPELQDDLVPALKNDETCTPRI